MIDNNVHGLTAYVGRLKPTLMYRLALTAEDSRRTSYKLLNTSAAYAAKLSHKRINSLVCEAGYE